MAAAPSSPPGQDRPWQAAAWVLAVGLLSRAWVLGMAWLANDRLGLGRSTERLMCSWDCGWYWNLIEGGYHLQPAADGAGESANWAFFPLFPMLVRLVMQATGWHMLVASQLVVNLAFLAALVLLHAHVRRLVDDATARFVVVALAFSPFSLYFSAPYTESLYLLLMVAVMHAARGGQWLLAGLCAAALSATRNLGVFIALPMLVLGLSQFGWRRVATLADGTERFVLALALVPLGLAAYMLFLHHLIGDALAFKHVQVSWGGGIGNPLATLYGALRHGSSYERYCAVAACLSLAAAVLLYRRGLRAEALILLIGTLIPAAVRIHSAPRYALTLYPVFLALGLALRHSPRARHLVVWAMLPPSVVLVASWVAQKTYMV
ncbi:mannosyltransferase family protein [Ideonella sp. A 288]|uniref:mannosyltransferase family protein n=1 Tax=Ideonella sp. A 288 TaxID=1962181 RepID=UPI000B4C1874|nr:mannosyltransferase family protein [Ideonella sp. A 288]